MNKAEPLNKEERKRIYDLNDPLLELILINGWRRAEVSQVLIGYNGGEYAYFKPKAKHKVMRFLLTNKEKLLINTLQNITFANTKKTMGAFNRAINRHFEGITSSLGFDQFFPHRLRATFGTQMSRMGVPPMTIKAAMNHKKLSTTEIYIQPGQEEIKEAKETIAELETIDGMTIQEWRKFALDKVKQINRLEEYIKHEHKRI